MERGRIHTFSIVLIANGMLHFPIELDTVCMPSKDLKNDYQRILI